MTEPLSRSRRPLGALFAASAISWTGNNMALIAVPWFVLQETDSAFKTGLAGFAFFLPIGVAALLGGGIIDRFGFRRVSIIADLASGATIALIPLLDSTVGLPFWALLTLVFFGGLLDTPGDTARMSLIPDLARLGNVSLEAANSGEQVAHRAAAMLGAPLAGILIGLLGPTEVLWIDAATFLISAGLIAFFVAEPERDPQSSPQTPGGFCQYLKDLREGWSFVLNHRLILTMVVTVGALNFLDTPLGAVVLPVYADEVYDSAAALGLLVGISGAASMLGAAAFGAWGGNLPRWQTYGSAFFLTGLMIWVLLLEPPLAVLAVAMALRGLFASPLNPILMTVYQERIPQHLRGRVFSTMTVVAWGANPLGVVAGGALIGVVGLFPTIAILATLYLLFSASILLNPIHAEMNRRPNAPAAAEAVDVNGSAASRSRSEAELNSDPTLSEPRQRSPSQRGKRT
jgi:MFS family permease